MNCKLIGYEAKTLEIILEPQESFYAEKGALVYMDEGILMETQMNGKGLIDILSSKFSGESVFIIKFFNASPTSKKLVLAGQRLGLEPVKITGYDHFVVRCGAYVASTEKVDISVNASIRKMLTGMGLVFQTVRGNATIFIDTCGKAIVNQLAHGQSIIVDENHILALLNIHDSQISTEYAVQNMFQGEGLAKTKITGPGTVYISPIAFLPQ